jgi:ankyrin repeat protein
MTARAALSFRATAEEYKEQAKALFDAVLADDESAHWRFKWQHPRFRDQPVSAVRGTTLSPGDAQIVTAREYHFDNWLDLMRFADAVAAGGPVTRFEEAVEAVVTGDAAGLRAMLRESPELAHARSTRRHHATLLHYVAANGVEGSRQKTPPNALEIAGILLDAGAEPDALADMYDNKCTTMSMLVSSTHPHGAGLQAALAEALLDHGASLEGPGTEWQSALRTALVFGYPDTAEVLVTRGARVGIVEAAGLGRVDEVRGLLSGAGEEDRHAALALAAQLGHADVVRLLLDAGTDPNRYNPAGFHSHATPLHQAVLSDNDEVVRLLVERGARLDVKDKLYEGTPLDWALHVEREGLADYLRSVNRT